MPTDRLSAGAPASGSILEEPLGTCVAGDAVRVYVADDKLSVLLDCPDPRRDLPGLVTRVLEAFKRLKLPEYPSAAELTEILAGCGASGRPLAGQPLVRGYAPVPPVNGRLEWSHDYFAEGWKEATAEGVFDFFARLDNRAVNADEVLVKVLPPVPGEPGLNVFGVRLPVGKPQKARLRCGKGVAQTEDDQGVLWCRAAVSGRVRLSDGTLAVDDVYVIRGNLGLATGNVRHPGTLQVEGDIQQGVTIDVQGDIVVRGMIEPCTITAGGSLQVAGGIVGHEECRITLGGGLQARYVSDAVIDAIGDVVVAGEISHARIRTLGRVLAPAGRIAGGLTVARGGITVGQAGAAGATGTELVAGVDYLLEPRVAALEEQLARLENRRIRTERRLEQPPMAGDADADTVSPAAAGERAIDLAELSERAAQIKSGILDLIAASEAACHPEIAALQEVWSGTAIQLGRERLPVRASVRKPRLARLSKGRVRLLPLGEGNMPDEE